MFESSQRRNFSTLTSTKTNEKNDLLSDGVLVEAQAVG